MKKFFGEFKKFITRGNVFDLAVGMIIATAFNKIVSSLVNDIIMPLITYALGASSVKDLSIPLRYEWVDGVKKVSLSWNYGSFLQYVIDFFIIALSVFIMVKVVTASRKRLEEFGEMIEKQTKKELRLARKEVKKLAKEQNRKFKEVWVEQEAEKKRIAEEKAKLEAEEKAKKEAEARLNNPTQEDLLKDIRDLLKQQTVKTKVKNKNKE
jgi:large conductance mechanosensitive channel